jgi:transcription elongation factor GreB
MKTPLITREGYEKLKKEMDTLWREERPEVTKKVTWAASLGDRSENADYQYNKKRLREIDRRVRYLTKCLEQLKIVDYSPQQEGRSFSARGWRLKTMRARRSAFGLSATMKSLAATTTSPLIRQWRARC